jgi:thiamine-monophosphate kinase
VGASVRLAQLPLSAAYRRATARQEAPWREALSGGEDYELCVTVPQRHLRTAMARARALGLPLRPIGTVTRARGVQVAWPDGGHHPVAAGHDHLAAVRRLARRS